MSTPEDSKKKRMRPLIESLRSSFETLHLGIYVQCREYIMNDTEFMWVIQWDPMYSHGCICYLYRNCEKVEEFEYEKEVLESIWYNENVIIFIFWQSFYVYNRFTQCTNGIYMETDANDYVYNDEDFKIVKFETSADGYYVYYTKLAYNTMTHQTTNLIEEYADSRILLFNLLG